MAARLPRRSNSGSMLGVLRVSCQSGGRESRPAEARPLGMYTRKGCARRADSASTFHSPIGRMRLVRHSRAAHVALQQRHAFIAPPGLAHQRASTRHGQCLVASMSPLMNRRLFLGVALLTGCHAYAYYEPALPPPPPPPAMPPPGAPWLPPDDDSTGSSAPPASTPHEQEPVAAPANSARQGQPSAGPLPALPSQAPQYAPTAPSEPPSASEWVRSYPEGQWVYHATSGWIWIPAGAAAAGIDGVPYTYLYTPRYGWTWYVSPWGWGHYHYGPWVVRHAGWRHTWVAHPHIVIRLGRPRRR